MAKIYMKLALAAILLCGGSLMTKGITVNDLVGRYNLVAKASTYNGANGFAPSSEITITIADAESNEVTIFGFFGKNYEVPATFDASTNSLSIPAATAVDMTIPSNSSTLASFIQLGGFDESGTFMGDGVQLKVSDDAKTITAEESDSIAVGAWSFMSGSTVLETIKGFTATREEVKNYSDDDIDGAYSYTPTNEIEVFEGSEDLAEKFSQTNLTFKLVSTGEHTFNMTGLFGTEGAIKATYVPEIGQIILNTSSNNEEPAVVYTDDRGDYTIDEMFSNTRFDVNGNELKTTGNLTLRLREDESNYTTILINRNGGIAKLVDSNGIKDITADDTIVDVYTVDGKLIKRHVDVNRLNTGKGFYILKGKNTTRKVVF